ncbi:MAG: cadherin repeat domain-containing protein [Planctomycetaceae bacterium]
MILPRSQFSCSLLLIVTVLATLTPNIAVSDDDAAAQAHVEVNASQREAIDSGHAVLGSASADLIDDSSLVLRLDENAQPRTRIGSVRSLAPDADHFRLTTNAGAGLFDLDEITGALTTSQGAVFDHESRSEIDLTIVALKRRSSSEPLFEEFRNSLREAAVGESRLKELTYDEVPIRVLIRVSDVNEPPVIAAQHFEVPENADSAVPFARLEATDADRDDVLTFSITSGSADSAFAVSDDGSLTIRDSALLDYELQPSHELRVRVSDQQGLAAEAVVVVEVTDVNEAPVIQFEPAEEPSIAGERTVIGNISATDPENRGPLSVDVNYELADGNLEFDASTGLLLLTQDSGRPDISARTVTLHVRVVDADGMATDVDLPVDLPAQESSPSKTVSVDEPTTMQPPVDENPSAWPVWLTAVAGLLLVVTAVVLARVLRRRKKNQSEQKAADAIHAALARRSRCVFDGGVPERRANHRAFENADADSARLRVVPCHPVDTWHEIGDSEFAEVPTSADLVSQPAANTTAGPEREFAATDSMDVHQPASTECDCTAPDSQAAVVVAETEVANHHVDDTFAASGECPPAQEIQSSEPAAANPETQGSGEDVLGLRRELSELFGTPFSADSPSPSVQEPADNSPLVAEVPWHQLHSDPNTTETAEPVGADVEVAFDATYDNTTDEELRSFVDNYMSQLVSRSRSREQTVHCEAVTAVEHPGPKRSKSSWPEVDRRAAPVSKPAITGTNLSNAAAPATPTGETTSAENPAVPARVVRPTLDREKMRNSMASFRTVAAHSIEQAIASHDRMTAKRRLTGRRRILLTIVLALATTVIFDLLRVVDLGWLVWLLSISAVIAAGELTLKIRQVRRQFQLLRQQVVRDCIAESGNSGDVT